MYFPFFTRRAGKKDEVTLRGGRYRIVEQLGEGGMGTVYRAVTKRGKSVAIKEIGQKNIVPQVVVQTANAMHHEAGMLSRVAHPQIPHLIEAFCEAYRSYLVMDLIEGQTLASYKKSLPGERVPLKEVIDIWLQLCGILGYLHALTPPILYLDLKPANVMRSPSGRVFLVDFGIAQAVGEKTDAFASSVAFTPTFASPEQQRFPSMVTPKSDVFGLGVTIDTLLAGCGPADVMSQLSKMKSNDARFRPSLAAVAEFLSSYSLPANEDLSSQPLLSADEPTAFPTTHRLAV
jgi:eukaryotic-like serine/threonine-protein kinase